MGWSAGTRQIIYARAGQCCERCGRWADGGSVHHRRPRGMGGTTDPVADSVANGVLLCGSGVTGCHGWVENNRTEALKAGWLVPQGHDPAAITIPHRFFGPMFLGPDGDYVYPED